MIDVVVPVFDQPLLARRAIASVLRTADVPFRLVVVDDASPDPGVAELLATLRGDPRCLIFRNRRNRGFVATANRAFRMSPNDVVLLNSDAVVTPGWLRKLAECARSAPRVASVTPLTNDGTICSVPEPDRRNDLPPGTALEDYARRIEEASARLRPELPTAVGFCVYLTREALDAVGDFDEATFGRGYGEENDWCLRASALGFRHLLDDATFVWHEGGGSFGEGKARLEEEGYRAVCRKHPDYPLAIRRFAEEDPVGPVRRRIRRRVWQREPALRVLVALHAPPESLGGTESHTRDLLRHARDVEFVVLHPEGEAFVVEEWRGGVRVASRRLPPPEPHRAAARALYERILREEDPDVLHVQHFLAHEAALAEAAEHLRVPLVLAWHDHYLACIRYKLRNDRGEFCEWCADLVECDRCLGASESLPVGFQAAWRRRSRAIVARTAVHVFPSASVRAGAQRLFDVPEARTVVVPHGHPAEPPAVGRAAPPGGRLRVAFLGSFLPDKGSRLFADVARMLGKERFEWHVYGPVDEEEASELSGFELHGRYARDRIAGRLRRDAIDVVFLVSTWPETFSYTLSEAWMAGVPVLGSSLGAIGERIREHGGGWTVDPRDPGAIASRLSEIADDRAELARRTAEARAVVLPGVEAMAAAYAEIYRAVARGARARLASAPAAVPAP